MNKTILLRAVTCALIMGLSMAAAGCGSSVDATTPTLASTSISASAGDEAPLDGALLTDDGSLLADASELGALDQATAAADISSLAALPQAPWSASPVAADGGNAGLVQVWSQADNSSFCAPLSLSADAVGDAQARTTSLAGGWAIEFDQRGAPGVRENGASCTRCGRGAFGIAGTGMSPDEVFDLDENDDVTPTFRDGSMVELAAVEEGVASATLTVQGQGCVYQVWSFLGQDHLDALLAHLRFVRVDAPSSAAVATIGE